ncbi:anthranilate phosphoribosyltransferase, partial [bacterium]
ATENAVIIEQILNGSEGPSADVTCLNAAAVLQVADIAPDWHEALKLARAATASGAARETLRTIRDFTSQFAS